LKKGGGVVGPLKTNRGVKILWRGVVLRDLGSRKIKGKPLALWGGSKKLKGVVKQRLDHFILGGEVMRRYLTQSKGWWGAGASEIGVTIVGGV